MGRSSSAWKLVYGSFGAFLYDATESFNIHFNVSLFFTARESAIGARNAEEGNYEFRHLAEIVKNRREYIKKKW